MANNTTTVVEAGNQAQALPLDPVVIAGVLGITGLVSAAVYLYFNDQQYNFLTRAVSWIGEKVRDEEDSRQFDEEELKEDIEKTVEKAEENGDDVGDPQEIYNTVTAIAENKEWIGREEERKKQRKEENLKDILTVTLIITGVNLLLRLFEMFGGM